jgi:hypothetical protein
VKGGEQTDSRKVKSKALPTAGPCPYEDSSLLERPKRVDYHSGDIHCDPALSDPLALDPRLPYLPGPWRCAKLATFAVDRDDPSMDICIEE